MFKFLQNACESHPVKVSLKSGDEVCIHKVVRVTNDNSGVIVRVCDGTEHKLVQDEILEING